MELRHLRYFLVVADELHFGRAAARLRITQPPLSQQIRQLEDQLGVVLLQRTKRRVQLTDAGRAFQEAARQVLAQAEQAVQTAQRAHRGELGPLTVGFVGSAIAGIFLELLSAFRTRCPDVELTLQELTTAQQVQALREWRIDVGVLRPPIGEEALALETIGRESLVVVLPKTHPWQRSVGFRSMPWLTRRLCSPRATWGRGYRMRSWNSVTARDAIRSVCQARRRCWRSLGWWPPGWGSRSFQPPCAQCNGKGSSTGLYRTRCHRPN